MLLATTVEALQADCGRLSELDEHGVARRRGWRSADRPPALDAAELALGAPQAARSRSPSATATCWPSRARSAPFSAVERDLLEHLAAQAAVSLENLRLEELMRRTEAELRAILEGVADAVAAEDPDGPLVYVNAAAARLLGGARRLGAALGIAADLLPGRHVVRRRARPSRSWSEHAAPLVAREGQPGAREAAAPRLAISVVEDITEIKQAEEAQRFLAEARACSRARCSLDGDAAGGGAARRAHCRAAACVIDARRARRRDAWAGDAGDADPRRAAACARRRSCSRAAASTAATAGRVSALRVGAAVENARLYRTRAAIAHTLQHSLLPPELPEIPGLETAALYRPAGEGNEVGGDFYDVFPTGERRVVRGHRRRLRQGRRGRRGDRAGPLHDPRRGRCATAPRPASCAGSTRRCCASAPGAS